MENLKIKKTFIKPDFFVVACLDVILSSVDRDDPSSNYNMDWFNGYLIG